MDDNTHRFTRAREAVSRRQFGRARQLLAPVVRTDPDAFDAWALLVEVELGLEDRESAEICAQNALVALQEAMERAGRLTAESAADKAIVALDGLWHLVVKGREWNPRIEIPFWEFYGDALVDLDQSVRAGICFGHVLRLRRRFMREEATGIGGAWQRLWATAFQQNRYAAARRRIRCALRWFHKGGANELTLGNAYGSLATLETELANRKGAFDAFEAAMRCYTQPEAAYLKAYILAKRARFYLQERDYAKALADFEEGLAIARRFGGKVLFDVALDAAHYDHQIGERLGDRGHLEMSWARLDEAESTGFTSAKAQSLRGMVAMTLGDLELARRHLLTATRIYAGFEKPDVLSQAYVVWNLGGVLAAEGKASRGLRLVRWATKRLEGIYGRFHPSYLNQKISEAAMLHRLGDAKGARACLRIVIDTERDVLERFMRKGLPLELAAHQRISVEAFQAYAGLTLADGGEAAGDDVLMALLATAGVARATLAATAQGRTDGPVRPLPDLPENVEFAAFLRIYSPEVSPDHKKWSIEWGAARTICITRSWLEGTRIHALGKAETVEAAIAKLRDRVRTGKTQSVPALLASVLSKDMGDRTPPDLIVLQSGLPAGIPLALCAPERRIVEIEGNWGDASASAGKTAGSLVVASSDFVRGAGDRIAGAPYILDEIEAAAFGSTARLLGDDASRENVVQALTTRPRRLHVIAHGYGSPGRASVSAFSEAGIALPVQGKVSGLSAYDIAVLDLQGIELVVLSACSTGIGRTMEGEGVASLASAFLQAGVATVLASLWPVGYAEASQFMGAFYALLVDCSATEALRRAQDSMRSKGLSTRDWAGWRLYARNIRAALDALGHATDLPR